MDKNKPSHSKDHWEELWAEAHRIGRRSSNLTASAANSTVLFALFVLECKLLESLRDPIASLDDILSITDSMALLNDTIKLYNAPLDQT